MNVEYRDWETKVLIASTSQVPPDVDYMIIKEDIYFVKQRWYNVTEDKLIIWVIKSNRGL